MRDDRKALHFVFPGTIYYLTIVKKKIYPARPVEPGTLRVFNWGAAYLTGT